MTPAVQKRLYAYLFNSIKVFFMRKRIVSARLPEGTPTIFIANHQGSYGPVTAMASLPQPVYPWVTHEITDLALCPKYIENDFVKPEVHLRPPVSSLLSRLIGRICVALMTDLHAIPVYKNSRRIAETIAMSVRLLEQGKRILIFPEIPNRIINEIVNEFDTGFINIARLFFERTARIVSFFPVAVNRGRMALHLGAPVRFNPLAPFRQEKVRIKRELVERICEMYREMEGQEKPTEVAPVS